MRLTAEDLLELELIDGIVPEPAGGAQEDTELAAANLRTELMRWMAKLTGLSATQLVEQRCAKFRRMGNFFA
jgi:acetyl-CoA carboxylase carboxyl transferase subunit alpha